MTALKPSFWEMCLSDFVAERTPRTRTPEMRVCQRLAREYVLKYPKAVEKAVEAANGNMEKVIPNLKPPYLEWVRREVPDLLEKPAGMY